MDSILIILKKKWPKGFICPYTGTIFYNIRVFSKSQVSVYRTIGPLVSLPYDLYSKPKVTLHCFCRYCFFFSDIGV